MNFELDYQNYRKIGAYQLKWHPLHSIQVKLEASLTEDNVNNVNKLDIPGVLSGKTLLYVACLLDNEEAVILLLRKGALVTLGKPLFITST